MTVPQGYVPQFRIAIGGEEFRHGFSGDIISLSVTDTCDRADSFSFMVRERHPESGHFPGGALLRWIDAGVFEEGKEVEIEFGYRGGGIQTFIGAISTVSPNFPESGPPTLNVRGFSHYQRLNRQCDGRPFRKKTDSGIAEEIAGLLELTPSVDATDAEHPLVSSRDGTYASILQQRAARIGYELVVKGRTLHFEKPRYLVSPGGVTTLEWGRNLKSFSPSLSTYRKVTKVTVRASQTSHARAKEPLVGSAGAGEERVKLGQQSASEIALKIAGPNEMLAEDHLAVSAKEAGEIALAKLETSSLDFITGRGGSVGNSGLSARTVITVKGVGKMFSGDYYVTSVTHTIDVGGYRTDFEVKRNGR